MDWDGLGWTGYRRGIDWPSQFIPRPFFIKKFDVRPLIIGDMYITLSRYYHINPYIVSR